jgi:hypothetical protein
MGVSYAELVQALDSLGDTAQGWKDKTVVCATVGEPDGRKASEWLLVSP